MEAQVDSIFASLLDAMIHELLDFSNSFTAHFDSYSTYLDGVEVDTPLETPPVSGNEFATLTIAVYIPGLTPIQSFFRTEGGSTVFSGARPQLNCTSMNSHWPEWMNSEEPEGGYKSDVQQKKFKEPFKVLEPMDEFEEYAFVDRTIEDNYYASIRNYLVEEEALHGDALLEWYDEGSDLETEWAHSTPASTAVKIDHSDLDARIEELAFELSNQSSRSHHIERQTSQGPQWPAHLPQPVPRRPIIEPDYAAIDAGLEELALFPSNQAVRLRYIELEIFEGHQWPGFMQEPEPLNYTLESDELQHWSGWVFATRAGETAFNRQSRMRAPRGIESYTIGANGPQFR